jgi:hypothetical protein
MVPLIYNEQESIYKEQGITFELLEHLDDIGLVSFTAISRYSQIELPKHSCFSYYEIPINIEFPMEKGNQLEIGKVILTQIGQQLAPICGSKPIPGFS